MPVPVIKIGALISILVLLGCNEHERLKMKAKMGNRDAMRIYGVRILNYTSGRQDEVDEAVKWITKAAEKGDTQAMYELGAFSGGATDSTGKAKYWYRKGAEAGNPDCMGKLAEAYRYGYLGLEKDEKQYRYWMDKAMAIDRVREKDWVSR